MRSSTSVQAISIDSASIEAISIDSASIEAISIDSASIECNSSSSELDYLQDELLRLGSPSVEPVISDNNEVNRVIHYGENIGDFF
jgi:hypothetical protein